MPFSTFTLTRLNNRMLKKGLGLAKSLGLKKVSVSLFESRSRSRKVSGFGSRSRSRFLKIFAHPWKQGILSASTVQERQVALVPIDRLLSLLTGYRCTGS